MNLLLNESTKNKKTNKNILQNRKIKIFKKFIFFLLNIKHKSPTEIEL